MNERGIRIAIIGNGGGGKTTLARRLAERLELPLHHVDSVQFLPGLERRREDETRAILDPLAQDERWVIDGFGPADVMERRFERSTTIVFVDFPIWRHYFWAAKRQVRALWHTRSELPYGSSEAGIRPTVKLFRILWRVHREIRPWLLEQFERPGIHPRVVRVRTIDDWYRVFHWTEDDLP